MQPCNLVSAEGHNNRTREVTGTRKDLEANNHYKVFETISERMLKIKDAYKETTGQRMQGKPIREIVVTGITEVRQAEEFVNYLEERMKYSVLSWAIHADEGHYDIESKEWIPNPHAHFIIDLTIWDREPQLVPQKKNGKCIRDETGEIVFVERVKYGTQRPFRKKDLAQMQTVAAGITGWDRGIPSTADHINILQYKAMKIQEDLEILSKRKKDYSEEVEKLRLSILRCQIDEGNLNESFRNWISCSKQLANKLLLNYDRLLKADSNESSEGRSLMPTMQRDALFATVNKNPEDDQMASRSRYLQELIESIRRFVEAVNRYYNAIENDARNRVLELKKEAKRFSTINSAKGFVRSVLDMPANKQVQDLNEQVKAGKIQRQHLEEEMAKLKMENERLAAQANLANREKERATRFSEEYVTAKKQAENVKRSVCNMISQKAFPTDVARLKGFGVNILLGEFWDAVEFNVENRYSSGPEASEGREY